MADAQKAGWSALSLPRTERHNVVTVDEVCQYLRVHRTTLYRLIKQGRIPAFRVGGRWRLNLVDIERWLHDQGLDD